MNVACAFSVYAYYDAFTIDIKGVQAMRLNKWSSVYIGILLLIVGMLAACSHEVNKQASFTPPTEEEKSYALSYGWHILSISGESEYNIKQLYPERVEKMKGIGLDVDACSSGQFRSRSFNVSEKQQDGGAIGISILYCEGEDEIFGGSGGLENWTPGIFAIHDKQRLLNR